METSKKINRTYYCILCEMSGFDYETDEPTKKLTKKIKRYLMDYLNTQTKSGKMYDPIFACSIANFYGYHLSWSKNEWRKSAKIVYDYFKASSLIKTIHKYESIFNTQIIHDYNALLSYLVEKISNSKEIIIDLAPGVSSYITLIPESIFEEQLYSFVKLYE